MSLYDSADTAAEHHRLAREFAARELDDIARVFRERIGVTYDGYEVAEHLAGRARGLRGDYAERCDGGYSHDT